MALFCGTAVLQADMTSTNYAVVHGNFIGGGATDITSASYEVEEGVIGTVAQGSSSSTNYAASAQAGNAYNAAGVPIIQSISPEGNSAYFTDENADYEVTASNPGGGSLEYQIRSDGTVKDAWQSSNQLTYTLSSEDYGRHELKVEVRNNASMVVQEIDQYVFHRPVK